MIVGIATISLEVRSTRPHDGWRGAAQAPARDDTGANRVLVSEHDCLYQLTTLAPVLDELPIGVWLADAEGRLLWGNRTALRLWGGEQLRRAEDCSVRLKGWWPETDTAIAAEEWPVRRALARGEAVRDRLIKTRGADGRWRFLRQSAVPLEGDGRPRGAVIIDQDVTDYIDAEEEQQLLINIARSSGDAVIGQSLDTRITFWNPAAEQLFGYRAEEVLGRTIAVVTPPALKHTLCELYQRVAQGEEIHQLPGRALHKSGELIDIALTMAPIRDRQGQIRGFVTACRDQRAHRQAERTLRLWGQALAASADGVIIVDARPPRRRIVFVNEALARLTGYRPQQLIGRTDRILLSRELDQPGLLELEQAMAEGRDAKVTLHTYHRDGTPLWIEVSVAPVRNSRGQPTHYVEIVSDVSERIRYQEELAHQANHDSLTGLPNRSLLRDRLHQALASAHRSGSRVALLFMDLDAFKYVNDSLGHDAGDQLLQMVSRKLVNCVREEDTVARLGGDEFVMILEDLDQPSDAGAVANKIMATLSQPFTLSGREIYIGCSIGIAVYPNDGEDETELLKKADAAMYRAKGAGKNTFRFYQPELDRHASERLSLESALRGAIRREEFVLHFQPQWDARDGTVVGVEALLRWQHPQRGLLGPDVFMPLAEETGLVVPIGRWILSAACAQMSIWREHFDWNFPMAVNLSARQFGDSGLLRTVLEALFDSRLPADGLELELTESMLMREPDTVLRTLRAFKDHGIRLAIDDFGSGYSSLNYLRRFPVDKLKMDRAFVADVCAGQREAALVGSIVALGHSLGLTVIAEGVENREQLAYLQRVDCDQVQGYLVGRPQPAPSLTQLVRACGGRLREPWWSSPHTH